MTHFYENSRRPIQPGDAAYLWHDSGAFGYEYVPVIIVRVNEVSVTIRGRADRNVRLPHGAPRNNVAFSFADDEDPDHDLIRKALEVSMKP